MALQAFLLSSRTEILRSGSSSRSGVIAGSLHLTVEHRRQRAAYHEDGTGLPNSTRTGRQVSMAQLRRPDTLSWTRRELQALMLHEDVELFAHQALGALRSAVERGGGGPGSADVRGCCAGWNCAHKGSCACTDAVH